MHCCPSKHTHTIPVLTAPAKPIDFAIENCNYRKAYEFTPRKKLVLFHVSFTQGGLNLRYFMRGMPSQAGYCAPTGTRTRDDRIGWIGQSCDQCDTTHERSLRQTGHGSHRYYPFRSDSINASLSLSTWLDYSDDPASLRPVTGETRMLLPRAILVEATNRTTMEAARNSFHKRANTFQRIERLLGNWNAGGYFDPGWVWLVTFHGIG